MQKSITESNHGVIDYMVVANAAWWDKLPADIRKGLTDAMDESIKFGNKVASDEEKTYRQKVIDDKKADVVKISAAEPRQGRDAMKPVWQKFEGEIGKDVIEAAVKSNTP